MSKPVIYEYNTERFWRQLARKPKFMWVKTGKGIAKILNPAFDPRGMCVTGSVTVSPRYQVKISNIP